MMPRGAAHIWRALLLLLLLPGVRTTDGEPRALRTHSASLSSTSHSPVQHIDIARAFPRNRTLALFIAGTRVRFLSRTLLQQVHVAAGLLLCCSALTGAACCGLYYPGLVHAALGLGVVHTAPVQFMQHRSGS